MSDVGRKLRDSCETEETPGASLNVLTLNIMKNNIFGGTIFRTRIYISLAFSRFF